MVQKRLKGAGTVHFPTALRTCAAGTAQLTYKECRSQPGQNLGFAIPRLPFQGSKSTPATNTRRTHPCFGLSVPSHSPPSHCDHENQTGQGSCFPVWLRCCGALLWTLAELLSLCEQLEPLSAHWQGVQKQHAGLCTPDHRSGSFLGRSKLCPPLQLNGSTAWLSNQGAATRQGLL